ncbi:MAG: hypothetical protein CL610_19125 [Anaerolineaceae bacterium]|nr:hypothetical protein [Anaerolineaceae bacterium]
MTISRRQFLQFAGIALVSPYAAQFSLPERAVAHGRALSATPVFASANADSQILRHLWPDSITPISARSGAWYRADDGYIRKTDVQPLMLDAPTGAPAPVMSPPLIAEVRAPATSIRAWAAADAPLVTRMGHGAVAPIIDLLPGQINWYGIADDAGDLLGWSQTTDWQQAVHQQPQLPLTITLNQQTQQLTVAVDERQVLQAAVSTGSPLETGVYALQHRNAGTIRSDSYHGVAWPLQFGEAGTMAGVYWHNNFGARVSGLAVQVPTYLARWLYGACGEGSTIVIEP